MVIDLIFVCMKNTITAKNKLNPVVAISIINWYENIEIPELTISSSLSAKS
jgi:hypothetical protein